MATTQTLAQFMRAARSTSTPILRLETPDPWATIQRIRDSFEEGSAPLPLFCWDIERGLRGLNKLALDTLQSILGEPKDWPGMTGNPGEALNWLLQLPGEQVDREDNVTQRGSLVFFLNAQRYLDGDKQDIPTIQGICNLRDPFKQNRRTLVLLTSGMALPPELAQDTVTYEEPLPDDTELATIVKEQYEGAGLTVNGSLENAVDAVRGLSAFVAEQVVAMSLTDKGLDEDMLWLRTKSAIEQTRGLSVDRGDESFATIGGLAQVKSFGLRLLKSARRPRMFVRLDELEKYLGGTGTTGGPADNTGVSQDRLGVILREMEDNDWAGLLAVGPAGSGKTLLSKALGNSSDPRRLSLAMDLGAMSQSRVGESEQNIRAAMRRIKAVAGYGGAFFIGCCNRLTVLPPELRRRFRMGIWYFDLPDAEEKEVIWQIALARYGFKASLKRPDDRNWTGADIRNCCDVAQRLTCTLVEAAQYLVPVAKSNPESIDELRQLAHGRFLSASKPGVYQAPSERLVGGMLSEPLATSAPQRARRGGL